MSIFDRMRRATNLEKPAKIQLVELLFIAVTLVATFNQKMTPDYLSWLYPLFAVASVGYFIFAQNGTQPKKYTLVTFFVAATASGLLASSIVLNIPKDLSLALVYPILSLLLYVVLIPLIYFALEIR